MDSRRGVVVRDDADVMEIPDTLLPVPVDMFIIFFILCVSE